MLLNKQNLQIANLADSGASRFTLNAIQVSQKWTATTNGHYLVCVTLPTENGDDSCFPQVPNFTPTNGSTPTFLLKRDDALEIAKSIPAKSTIPVLKHAQVGIGNLDKYAGDTEPIQLAVTDCSSHRVFNPQKVDGTFPNIEAVLPKFDKDSPATVTIGLNAEYLMKLAKSAIDTCKTGSRDAVNIKLEIKDGNHAVKMTAGNKDTGQDWMAVLMPVRF